MIVAIISIIFSFLLDNFFSVNIAYSITEPSWFSTIYTLICLFVIFPYFINQKKFLIILIVCAVLFDVVYTGTMFVNLSIFIILYFIIKKINYLLPNNILMANVLSLIGIAMYHLLCFAILNIVKYNVYDLSLLFKILTHSIIATILYTSIIYSVLSKVYDKLNIKQIK